MNSKQNALTETYLKLKHLVEKVAWNHWEHFGGDVEEHIANANLLFIEAFNNYDSSKSQIQTHIWHRIYYGLLSIENKEQERKRIRVKTISNKDSLFFTHPETVKITELLDEINSDLKLLILMAFEPDGRKPTKKNLTQNLIKEGWTWGQIRNEIKNLEEILS